MYKRLLQFLVIIKTCSPRDGLCNVTMVWCVGLCRSGQQLQRTELAVRGGGMLDRLVTVRVDLILESDSCPGSKEQLHSISHPDTIFFDFES